MSEHGGWDRAILRVAAWLVLVASLGACSDGDAVRRFPLREPIWFDPDTRPFAAMPEAYWSPLRWDTADQIFFRRFAELWRFEVDGPAVNVNSLDEVPDSSWYENRLGHRALTPGEVALGPCRPQDLLTGDEPLIVTGGKSEGAVPGFVAKTADGRRFMIKVDGRNQPERGTAADVIVSKLYWAAGYHVPCNQIVFFDPANVSIRDDATVELEDGTEVAMTPAHLAEIYDAAVQRPDGRLRASASLFLEGRPLGPWTYEGVREDDPNDVIPHEQRRDVRGMYPLAAWVNHYDTLTRNTLAMFIEVVPPPEDAGEDAVGAGYVRHNMLDFADSLGSVWSTDAFARRLGHAYYLDITELATDFFTLGVVSRPWDEGRYGASGIVFGYFDLEPFEPDEWKPGIPNPAFDQLQEHDAAWMARKLALIDDAMLHAVVAEAKFGSPELAAELERILRGRRDKILARWLVDTPLSPLTSPRVRTSDIGAPELCLEDRAVQGEVVLASTRQYRARAWGDAMQPLLASGLRIHDQGRLCLDLPAQDGTSLDEPAYLVLEVFAWSPGITRHAPLVVHLYQVGEGEYRVVGLERPEESAIPEAEE